VPNNAKTISSAAPSHTQEFFHHGGDDDGDEDVDDGVDGGGTGSGGVSTPG
jgi:hypothetical protein